jgi:hypothetical protein
MTLETIYEITAMTDREINEQLSECPSSFGIREILARPNRPSFGAWHSAASQPQFVQGYSSFEREYAPGLFHVRIPLLTEAEHQSIAIVGMIITS